MFKLCLFSEDLLLQDGLGSDLVFHCLLCVQEVCIACIKAVGHLVDVSLALADGIEVVLELKVAGVFMKYYGYLFGNHALEMVGVWRLQFRRCQVHFSVEVVNVA